ncbi:MAG: 4-hydroxy-3-methylbut-2-enyl diphosphate reductase [Alphaproteobacteria bacterium]
MPNLRILLASPRGFCAGVERAINAVEDALQHFGAPVYVRHEIVHNQRVVQNLARKGAVFINELNQAPKNKPVITSAHGIPQNVAKNAQKHNLIHIDATCPLVEKVHSEVRRHVAQGRQVILIGHQNHPEVTGTLGQTPIGSVLLVETHSDCQKIQPNNPNQLAWATQTTLSVRDTAEMIQILKSRFPKIQGPKKSDICYATENRQSAVALLAPQCQLFIVIGSANSSNSQRLVEVAKSSGCPQAIRIENAEHLPPITELKKIQTLGLTAGASAPEELIQEVLASLAQNFNLSIHKQNAEEEDVRFQPPRILRQIIPANH